MENGIVENNLPVGSTLWHSHDFNSSKLLSLYRLFYNYLLQSIKICTRCNSHSAPCI